MFVFHNRLVLKTCGTTTLLNAVPRIFEIARDYCGLDDIESLFYSRKAFLFPERQIFPHGKWGDEVRIQKIPTLSLSFFSSLNKLLNFFLIR
jgi:S-adenosylmethionine decarboxylase